MIKELLVQRPHFELHYYYYKLKTLMDELDNSLNQLKKRLIRQKVDQKKLLRMYQGNTNRWKMHKRKKSWEIEDKKRENVAATISEKKYHQDFFRRDKR